MKTKSKIVYAKEPAISLVLRVEAQQAAGLLVQSRDWMTPADPLDAIRLGLALDEIASLLDAINQTFGTAYTTERS